MTQSLFSRQRIFLLFLFIALILLLPATGSAQTKSYYWEQFNVDVTVLDDGDLQVVERQTLVFSGAPFTNGFRTVPVGRNGNNDGITNISVGEGDIKYERATSRAPNTFRVVDGSREVEIYWYFPATTGRHTYTVSYTVEGAIRTEPSGDQVFWNALPADLGARVENSTITIRLPEGIQAEATTALFSGDEDRNLTTSVGENGRRVTFQLTQPRPAGTTVEVGVRFPSGQLQLETPGWQRAEQLNDVIGLILLVVALLIAIGGPLLVLLLWYLRGRDPETGPVPEYLAEPPSDLPPAVVGTLVDERAHMHDILSTLVDLAERGYLTMTEKAGKEYQFRRANKSLDDLRPFEREMVKGIFRNKQIQDLEDLRYKFASRLPKIREHLYEELEKHKFVRTSPQSVRSRYGCLGWVGLFGAGAGMFVMGGIFENIGTAICPAIALGLTAVVLLITSRYMPAKTAKGAEEAAKWMAFKKYLQDIEAHTNLEEATEIFEKYLGYAVAFGMERSWIRKFTRVPNTRIPPWYIPYGYGHMMGRTRPAGSGSSGSGDSMPSLEGMSGGLSGGLEGMSSGLTRMLNNTQTVLQSTRSSSGSGSSFGGGGFSGGFSGGSSGGGSGGFG